MNAKKALKLVNESKIRSNLKVHRRPSVYQIRPELPGLLVDYSQKGGIWGKKKQKTLSPACDFGLP